MVVQRRLPQEEIMPSAARARAAKQYVRPRLPVKVACRDVVCLRQSLHGPTLPLRDVVRTRTS